MAMIMSVVAVILAIAAIFVGNKLRKINAEREREIRRF